jgi:ion channel-forming bestrophin family protein
VLNRVKPRALLRYNWRYLVVSFVLDTVIAIAYVFGGWTWLAIHSVPLSIIGGVIGLITGFRNTSAYARWWEARTIWGRIINSSRSFAREVLTMIVDPASDEAPPDLCDVQRRLVSLQIAFVYTLKNHLRGLPPCADLAGLIQQHEIEPFKAHRNVPLAVQQQIALLIAYCHREGWIDNIRWVNFDRTLSDLMDHLGGAERIKNTPMPQLYDTLIRVAVAIYCLVLPLGMVEHLGLWTPLGSTLVGLLFITFDKIGRELESPFENLPNDISLTAITRTIEINLKEMMGEKDIPEPVAPVDGILW